jgi:hypothetical protein
LKDFPRLVVPIASMIVVLMVREVRNLKVEEATILSWPPVREYLSHAQHSSSSKVSSST